MKDEGNKCKHKWEKVGEYFRRGSIFNRPKIKAILYVCENCLEKRVVDV